MKHILLLIFCVISVEVFVKLNFLSQLNTILSITKKIILVISKHNVSDHWKEKILPIYAFKIIRYSFRILLIFAFIFALFLIFNFIANDFLIHSFSLIGVMESIIFGFGYIFLRKKFHTNG